MNTQGKSRILFSIHGGIGKNIAATAVVASLKQTVTDLDIIVVTPYTFIWFNNPYIQAAINPEQEPNLYEKLIQDKKSIYLNHDPYHHEDYLYRKSHIIETWCSLIGIPCLTTTPSLYMTSHEFESVNAKLPKNKPLFFIQTNGGAPGQRFPVSWSRDLPLSIAQEVVSSMVLKGFEPVHLRRGDQPALKGVTWLNMSPRETICAIRFSSKRLFIDSFPQHAAAALGKKSTVTWITNNPKVFGYTFHDNIMPSIEPGFRHYPDSYFEQYDITGALHQCPYDTDKIFDVKEILASIEKQQ